MRFVAVCCLTLILAGCSKSRSFAPASKQTARPVSVSVLDATGSERILTAMFKDPNGASQIAEVTLSVMSNNVPPGGKGRWSAKECLIRYDVATNAIWLVPDVGGTWGSHSITAGSASTFSNSQCTVEASGSSAQIIGDALTVRVDLKFTPAFAGPKQVYLESEDTKGNWSSDYQRQFGSFTVAAVR
jgi:hypothetical protein